MKTESQTLNHNEDNMLPSQKVIFNYDVFISHAVVDKAEFTEEFVRLLTQTGLKVWYSGKNLYPGNKISLEVDKAISQSAYCIAIVSPAYLTNKWTMDEYRAFYAKETSARSIIIPIWHNISIEEVQKSSPMMVDRFSISSEKKLADIVTKIEAYIREKPEKVSSKNIWSNIRRLALSKNGQRTGIWGIILGLVIGSGTYINNKGNQYHIESARDVTIHPGAAERYESAWLSVDQEIKDLFTSLCSQLNQIEQDVPESFYDIRKAIVNETESAYQERARDYFRMYEKNIQMYQRQWPLDFAQYQMFARDLSNNKNTKQKIDLIYSRFKECKRLISDYQDELINLQRLDHLSDTERVAMAKSVRDLKIIDGKIALVVAVKTYAQLPEGNLNYPVEQLSLLNLPEKDLISKDWNILLQALQYSRNEVLSKQATVIQDAQDREVKRLVTDPYLLYLRRMTQRSDSLSEGEYMALKSKVLDTKTTNPADLFEKAAFSFIECDGHAATYYFRRAVKNNELSHKQRLFADLSINRIENYKIYQGSLGVMVISVDPKGNLDQAGMKLGDVIVAFEGKTIQEPYELSSLLDKANKNQVVLDVIRAEKPLRISISGRKSLGAQLTQLVVLQIVHI